MSNEMANFIDALHKADLEMTGEEVAEALWLATRLTPTEDMPSLPQPHIPSLSPQKPDFTLPTAGEPTLNPEIIARNKIYPHWPDPIEKDEAYRDEAFQSGKLVRMPTAAALADSLVLGRALRPLRRRARSHTRFVLDEEATVYQIAEMQKKVWIPVVEPAPERWFELALVIDEGASMVFWQQTIVELCIFFERLGAFRDIRQWKLLTDSREEVQLYVRAASATGEQRRRNPKELIDPTGRRLILVVTDCVSPAWYSGKVQALLELWGARNLVTLLQLLPQRLWPRTALCAAQRIHLTATAPGMANVQLKTPELPSTFVSKLSSLPLPLVTLHQHSLASWARMVMGAENTKAAGVLFAKDLAGLFAVSSLSPSQEEGPTAQQRVRYFRAAASPTAHKLARLLSATPITLPIVRVIQQTMLSEPEPTSDPSQVPVAEVFLGGLLKEVHRDPPVAHPEYVEYEFLEGVREELAKALPGADRYRVLREVSAFMEQHFGISHDFLARHAVPNALGEIFIGPESRPFATIAATVWRQLGGEYAELADALEQQMNAGNKSGDEVPTEQEQAKEIIEALKQAPDENARVATLDNLLEDLPGIWPSGIIQQALEIISSLENQEQRLQVLYKLLVHVPPELRAEIEVQIAELRIAITNTPPYLTDEISGERRGAGILEPPTLRRNNFSPFVKCICPSCFEEIYLGECKIISGITSGVVLKEPRGPFARMYVEPLDRPEYVRELARRECTNCGYHLPYNIELVPSISLAIVGDTFSGKSHYIAALIQQLKEEWAAKVQGLARMTCLTPEAEQKYITDYYQPLFIEKRMPLVTQPAVSERAEPLIYQLVVSKSRRHPTTTCNLMIYNAAGEDFYNGRLVQFARFVLNTSALIFVADPLAMAPLTNDLSPSLRVSLQRLLGLLQRRRVAEGFNEIIDVVERYRGHPSGSSLPDTPVAVMLSKSDLLKSVHPPPMLRLLRNPQYGGSLDLQDIEVVDQEVRSLLWHYKQGDMLAATRRLKYVKFFATSATGEPPDSNGNYVKVEPCRCLDPLLWILACYGIIQARV